LPTSGAGDAPPVNRALIALDVVLVVVGVLIAVVAAQGGAQEAQPDGQRVLLVGDSIAGELAGPLDAAYAAPGTTASFSLLPAVSTATIRTDVASILEQQQPDVVLVLIGTWEAVGVDTAVPGWEEAYADEVLQPFVQQVEDAGAEIVWLGYPRVGDAAEADQHEQMNAVYASLDERLDDSSVGYVDLGPPVEAPDGSFTTTVDVDGTPLLVRAEDGKHLCPAGAERVASAVVDALADEFGLEADEGWQQGAWRDDPTGFAEPGLCPGAFSDAALAATTTTAVPFPAG
jgi:hypothetical protein